MPESWAASGAAPSPVQRVLHSQNTWGSASHSEVGQSTVLGLVLKNGVRNHSWRGQLYLGVPRALESGHTPLRAGATEEQPALNISALASLREVSRKKIFGWFS